RMTPQTDSWKRLVEFARGRGALASAQDAAGADPADEQAPPGFSTRVVALAWRPESGLTWLNLLEGRAWRALALAAVIAGLCVGFNYGSIRDAIDRQVLDAQDPVTALLDF